jgi:hypothetical protein
MKREVKYFLAGTFITIAILVTFLFLFSKSSCELILLINLFLLSSSIIIDKKAFTQPIFTQMKIKWNTDVFLSGMKTIIICILFFSILYQLPEGESKRILSKWYFLLTLWAILILGLIQRYIKENKAEQKSRGPLKHTCDLSKD